MSEASYGGVDRGSFLAGVSAALGRRGIVRPDGPAPKVDEAIARVTTAGADLVAVFAERAVKAGMVVHRVQGSVAAASIITLLAAMKAQRIAAADVAALPLLAGELANAGMDCVAWRGEAGFEPLYECDAGITDVQAAIAETGTLVCWSGADRGRGLSLVPPLHIAVVRRSDIVPDLIDYLARHAASADGAVSPLPSSIAMITGPSKTADIEGVLITGVHGPREVHIVLIDDA